MKLKMDISFEPAVKGIYRKVCTLLKLVAINYFK